jgi:hypothetical protein
VHHIFNVIEYFSSLRVGRFDDPFTAEWKHRQLLAWVSLLLLVIGLVVLAAVGNMLDTPESASMLKPLADELRPGAAYILGGGLALLCLFVMYAWGAVLWFAHKHGAE